MPAAAADAELNRLFETVSGYFALLAEPTRLKILNALCDGERSVGEVAARVDSTQTNVSRHLNLMYGRGVLTRRREGAMTFYAVADANVVALCRSACSHIAGPAGDHAAGARALRRFMPKH
ncbi:MAG: ArsR/SmtB family transcription factor [Betaproteobacteria bacterium]